MSLQDYDSHCSRKTDISEPVTNQKPESTKIEYFDITEKQRGHGDQPTVLPTSSFLQARDSNGEYEEYALLLRRVVDKDGDPLSTTLEVRSHILRQALKVVLANCSILNLEACPITIEKPYGPLFHYREEIRKYAKHEDRTDEEKQHLKILTDFMRLNLGPTERVFDQMVPNSMITFDLLWTLFRAEDDIVIQTDHFQECMRVNHGEQKEIEGEQYFVLEGWQWGFNGNKFGPVKEVITIKEFQGSRHISQLPAFPLQTLDPLQQRKLCEDLISRGRAWKSLVGLAHREYDGPIWKNPPLEAARTKAELVISYVSERVILDHKSHEEHNFRLATYLIGSNGYIKPDLNMSADARFDMWIENRMNTEPEKPRGRLYNMRCYSNDDTYSMTDEQALLCPARCKGFTLSTKTWAYFLVDKVTQVEWSDKAFGCLELDASSKDAILALVQHHKYTAGIFDDHIAKKGKGLVMLLHGPPGTGKTLTAESVADFSNKPLYFIGTGELGTEASSMEFALQRIFSLANRWGAMLVLDEADLFLSRRSKDDMKRNAFVTIFLRVLEYYQGILFLTSNRASDIDPAFESRIHLKVPFPRLDEYKRAAIWRSLLGKLDDCCTWDAQAFDRLGTKYPLNGREIKNLIKPALAIAAFSKQALSEQILEDMYSLNYRNAPLVDAL